MVLRGLAIGVVIVALTSACGRAASSENVPREATVSEPEYREVTVPVDTVLPVELETTVASNESRVEDRVSARTRQAIVVDGGTVIPEGSTLTGIVTEARESGKVKGRAVVAFRFHTLRLAETATTYPIRTSSVRREASSTTKEDAVKVGAPAAGGAILGGIIGGKKGAAIGGVIGGGAGTAVVLNTAGEEVRLAPGTALSVKLLEPLSVLVPTQRLSVVN